MCAKYTDQEKVDAVRHLFNLKREGIVSIDDYTDVSNVRELCKELGISSYSLYKWAREVSENPERSLELINSDLESVSPRKDLKTVLSEINKEVNGIPKQNGFETFDRQAKKEVDNRLIVHSEIRFLGNLASMLNIKGYGSLPLKQLTLAVGLGFVKRSGLGDK